MSAPPRLGRGVTITRRQVSEEEIYYLVKDPGTGSFMRMGEIEAAVLRLLDGTRSLPEVAAALEQAHDVKLDVSVIETFVTTLTRRGLIESRVFHPKAFREEWLQQERSRRRTLGQALGTLTYLKVKLLNPARLFRRIVGPLSFFWSPAFVVVTMTLMAAGAVMSVIFHEEILRSARDYYVSATASGGALVSNALVFYLVLFLVVAVHEMAHGLTCTHFGGRVTDMGFILFYLQVPGMYCDITDAYSFERRSARLWTTFAGSYTGLLLAALGAFIWWMTQAGDMLNNIAILLMFIGGPPALAFNWNPLLKLDGYYMLMDFLEAPNLMDNSYRYLGYLFKSRILKVPVEPMPVPHRLRRVYVLYGIFSLLFLAPWIVYMPFVAFYIFSGLFGGIFAVAIATMVGWRMIGKPAAKAAATLRYAWLSHRPAAPAGQTGRVRIGLIALGAAAALALMLLGPRFAVRAEGYGVLEPMERIEVRAAFPGFVASLDRMPREGDRVVEGDLLVRLEDPELIAKLRDVSLEWEALRLERESLTARGDPAGAAERRSQELAAAEKAAILTAHREAMELKAPMSGVVLTPHLEERAGTWFKAGETWCVLGTPHRLRVRLALSERDLGVIHGDSPAEVKGLHLPGDTFEGRVIRMPAGRRSTPPGPGTIRSVAVAAPVAPADAIVPGSGSLGVDVEVGDALGLLRPGMTVRVRIYGERLTSAGHLARWARRLFKGKVWW